MEVIYLVALITLLITKRTLDKLRVSWILINFFQIVVAMYAFGEIARVNAALNDLKKEVLESEKNILFFY